MKKPGQTQEYKINKEFTDRNEARELFWKWYGKANENRDDFFVLSFYGIGGIGKSSLVNQLCRELTDKSGVYIKYDFEHSSGMDEYNILTGFKQSIRNKYGDTFQFPLFNAALTALEKKSDKKFENDEIKKSSVDESPQMRSFVSTLGLVPVVGNYIEKSVALAAQAYADFDNLSVSSSLKKKYKKDLQEMERFEADELRAIIPQCFGNDMAENTRRLLKPFVIFIDTYEKYIDTFKSASNTELDSWLREGPDSLIQRIPGILWVIAGRDRLNWDEDGEWDENHLKCQDVREFQPGDSKQYLNRAGITDDALVDHIVKITGGVPVYLDICVDTYYLLLKKGVKPVVKNFAVKRRKIVNRYVKYLDQVNRNLVYMLAAMGVWTDSEARAVWERRSSLGFSNELYNAVINHSFITSDKNWKRMHRIMIDTLMSEMDGKTVNDVNAALFHDRVSKLNTTDISYSENLSAIVLTAEAFCKITECDLYPTQYEDFRKLTEAVTDIRKKGFANEILSVAEKLNDHCGKCFDKTDYYGESLRTLADVLWGVGDYDGALTHDLSSYTFRENNLGKEHKDTLRSLNCVGVDYSCLGQHEAALKTHRQVYETSKRALGEEHPDTLRSLRNMGIAYRRMGRYEEALKEHRQVYETSKRALGEEHSDTLRSLRAIGVDYSNMGRHEKALEVDCQVYETSKRVLGEEHPDTLTSLRDIGIDYSNMGRHEKALEVDRQVYETNKRVLGEEHPDTLRSLRAIGIDYSNMGRHEKALEVDRQVYETRKRVLGEEHPDTIRSLRDIEIDDNNLHEKAHKAL